MKDLFYLIILVFIVSACNDKTDPFSTGDDNSAVAARDELVDLVNQVTHQISSSDPTINFSELDVLDDLANAKIIGMGEASHGTKEFFEMKHKMLRYFVEEHGFKGIIMEADFGECIRANEYVINNVGTIEELLADMYFWVWRTEEVKEMIEWMHDYNLDKPENEKIYYVGSDVQFTGKNIELMLQTTSQLPNEIQSSLVEYINELVVDIYDIDDEEIIEESLLKTDTIISQIQIHRSEIESLTSANEYEIFERLAIVTKQVYTSRYQRMQDDFYNYRDLYMAENAEWWSNHYGENEKFLVWAHNGHVCAGELNEFFGGSQGGHLRASLAEDYKVIGFSTAFGSLNAFSYTASAIVPEPLPVELQFSSLNQIFHLADYENFVWLIDDDVKNNPDFDWFNDERAFMRIGAIHPDTRPDYYWDTNIFIDYDVIIHFDLSTPTELIQ